MTTPQPMEIGAIGGENHEEEDGEVKVDAIGKGDGACRRCGGKGQFARDCVAPMGKGIEGRKANYGKGDYGKGDSSRGYKGYFKDHWQHDYQGKGAPQS